jgi:serine/threonine protein kinase
MRATLEAVAFMHEASMVHRSLSGASLLLSTNDDRVTDPQRIVVKLTDLGFATTIPEAAMDPSLLRRARRLGCANSPFEITAFVTGEDLHALGLAFLELLFSSLVAREAEEKEGALPSDQATFQRLYEDVFECDILRLRDYCMEEPIWEAAVSFLDEDGGSGWNFIEILLSARAVRAPANSFREAPAVLDPTARLVTARALMESPFLTRQLR